MNLSVRKLRGAGVGLCLGLATLAGGLAFSQPAQARVDVGIGIYVPVAPPAPRHEYRPPPPHRHAERVAWVPGHWQWNGHRYFWVNGYYAERPHHKTYYTAGHWEHHRDGYRWAEGGWR